MIAIEHAGAQRGLLILPFNEEYRIVAEAKTGADQVEVQVQQAAVGPSDLPDSLLRYVLRTQESVILDDASNQPQSRQLIRHGPADVGRGGNPAEMSESLFTEGEYVRQRRPKSILCLPVVKQARLMGVLYLETSEKITETRSEPGKEPVEARDLNQRKQSFVLIAVRDSGPGLDPKQLQRVFDTFYTTKSSGMGMGLAISRSIIEAHRGQLWVGSNTPTGAVFQFTLPVNAAPLPPSDQSA